MKHIRRWLTGGATTDDYLQVLVVLKGSANGMSRRELIEKTRLTYEDMMNVLQRVVRVGLVNVDPMTVPRKDWQPSRLGGDRFSLARKDNERSELSTGQEAALQPA